jgi:hypothetical protein
VIRSPIFYILAPGDLSVLSIAQTFHRCQPGIRMLAMKMIKIQRRSQCYSIIRALPSFSPFQSYLHNRFHSILLPDLNSLHIIRRDTLRNTPPLHLRPAIPRILLDQHKPLSLAHTPFRIALRRIIIQRNHVIEFLGPALGRYGWSLFLAGRVHAPCHRGAGVGVDGGGAGGRGDELQVGGGDDSFFVAGFDFCPSSV